MTYKKRKTGRCCLGALCKHSKHKLSPENTCPKCNLIVHALCGVFDNHLDKYCCQPCVDKKYTPLLLVPLIDPPVNSSPAATLGRFRLRFITAPTLCIVDMQNTIPLSIHHATRVLCSSTVQQKLLNCASFCSTFFKFLGGGIYTKARRSNNPNPPISQFLQYLR